MTPLIIEDTLRNPEHRELLLSGLCSAAGQTERRTVHQLRAAIARR